MWCYSLCVVIISKHDGKVIIVILILTRFSPTCGCLWVIQEHLHGSWLLASQRGNVFIKANLLELCFNSRAFGLCWKLTFRSQTITHVKYNKTHTYYCYILYTGLNNWKYSTNLMYCTYISPWFKLPVPVLKVVWKIKSTRFCLNVQSAWFIKRW